MGLDRKQKWGLSLAVTFAMLFSCVGTAAADGSAVPDPRPVITTGAVQELAFVAGMEENGTEKEDGPETENGSEENGSETEGGTGGDGIEPGDGMGGEGSKPGDGTGGNGTEPGDGTGGNGTESGDGTEGDGTESGDGTEGDGSKPGDGTGTDGAEAGDGTDADGSKPEDGTGADGGEMEGDDLPEGPDDGPSADLEAPDAVPPADLIPDAHEHSWSADWHYDGLHHWHECEDGDCPVTDESEMAGYGEHSFDDLGVCTDCGYDGMDGIATVAEGDIPTYREAYDAMYALKDVYPEGMPWTNFEPYGSNGQFGDHYTWKGGAIYGAKSAVGCMAFAFILSDEAFGSLPARTVERGRFTFEDVKVGDILRVKSNSHSVIVLQKSAGGVTVAEANYNRSVHWGRAMSAAAVENADFIITRYPKDYVPADDPGADDVVAEGKAGTLDWSLTEAGVLTISGKGVIPSYTAGTPAPWSGENVYTVIIEDGVTAIGDHAFYQSDALSVYIPDSVTSIGQNAFSGSRLVAVTIPGSVRTIEKGAFADCEDLTSATVSEGVTTIGDDAFRGCMTLGYIDFPASIRSVGAGAFMSCVEMVSVRFMSGSGKVTMGDNLFSQCWKLVHVTLPQTTERISGGMFASCSLLPELYIPASVQSIGENPFTSCNALGVINFGGSKAAWDRMASPYLQGSLQSTGTKVVFDAVFDDPFAGDPDDPGDFHPGVSGPCTDHVDADGDGKCDQCGATMPGGDPGPDEGTGSGGGEKDPSGSGGSDDAPTTYPSSGGGTSYRTKVRPNRSEGSGGNGTEGLGGSGSPIFSTTIRRNADGSSSITKTQKDGTVVTVTTDAAGKAAIGVKLSPLAIRTAEQGDGAVVLPIVPVQAVKDAAAATAITVHTGKAEPIKVAVPMVSPTADTVVLIVNTDGSTKAADTSVPAGDRVVVVLPDGATIKIVDSGLYQPQ